MDRLTLEHHHSSHNELIIDQFTKQSISFANMHAHSDEDAFQLLFNLCQVTKEDTVLDVACGPGLVACEFGKLASHVTGIDLTPAMIEQAKLLQKNKQLNNIKWDTGDVTHLPYEESSFSIVVSRYSFHHLLDPLSALLEMKRVCSVGGRVVVIDVTPPADRIDSYNYVEKLRDPSHVRAMPFTELQGMMDNVGLGSQKVGSYKLEMELEKILKASSTNPKNIDKIHQLFKEDLSKGTLGLESYYKDNAIHFKFPITIIVGRK